MEKRTKKQGKSENKKSKEIEKSKEKGGTGLFSRNFGFSGFWIPVAGRAFLNTRLFFKNFGWGRESLARQTLPQNNQISS